MPEKEKYKIDFGLGGESISAESRSELSDLISDEIQHWNELVQNKGPERLTKDAVFPIINSQLNKIKKLLQQNETTDDSALDQINSIASSLCRHDSQFATIVSDALRAGFLTNTSAAIIFDNKNAIGQTPINNNVDSFAASTGAFLRLLTHKSFGKIDAWGTTSDWIFEQKKLLTELKSLATNSKTELEKTKKLYKTELKLRASDSYWGKRASDHMLLGHLWMLATAASVALAIYVIHRLSNQLIEASAGSELDLPTAITKSVAFATITGIALWIIRFCSRVYNTHRHIQYDAQERVTMISSYLAFMNDSERVSSDHLDIILRSIFRPGSDGLVKDESGPTPTGIEIIQKLKPGGIQ